MSGPCGAWVTLGETQADPTAKLQSGAPLDPVLLEDMIDVASEVLYRLSGRQFAGVCEDTVLPLRRYYDSNGSFPLAWSQWRQWWGVHACGRPPVRNGGCGPLSEITLGAYPLRTIEEVRIDGHVIDPVTYRIDDRRWLVRTDQTAISWPCCSRLELDPMTDLNTFQVKFTWGEAPPRSGVAAAKLLAIELAKARAGDPCQLPQRLQNLSVQGATYALLDPLTFLDKGRTGVYLVDLFLNAVNPNFLKRRAQVISPDIGRPVRRAGTTPGS